MGYYDWEKIVAEKSDKELLRIYKERDREPDEKVKAVFLELKKRGLINSDEKIIEKSEKDDRIYDIHDIKETRPNSGRAVFAQSIILLIATLDIISIFSSYLQYNLLVSIKEGAIIEEGVANSNDLREQTIAIPLAIITVIIIRRHAVNEDLLYADEVKILRNKLP
jgi:hypothetical protein